MSESPAGRLRCAERRLAIGGLLLTLSLIPSAVAEDGKPDAASSEEGDVSLPSLFETSREDQMMRAYLRKRVHAKLDQRKERLEGLETEEQVRSYQDRLRGFFRETVDLDSFDRTPLRARVTGKLECDGYTVDKVIYESLPGFLVTANLYLPEGDGPFPGILHSCGHSDNGKAAEAYQKVNILLARQGFAVLCYDPIGQGERKQLVDPKTGRSLGQPTGEHHILGVAPVLLGRSLASYMIWDGMRGIDYLQSRPEVDAERIGATGNSGGGNLTSFLMALDDRIDAAAPGCFLTTTRRKNESPGPGDPEQNLFGQIQEGLDHPDFALIRAPRPTLILAATQDFVPIEGTWEAFRQAKQIYTKLGYPERIDLVEAPEKHGYSKPLREGAARFFLRWLAGENAEVFELEEVATVVDADLHASPEGQVLRLEEARSLFEVNLQRWEEMREEKERRWSHLESDADRRERVRQVTGIDLNLAEVVKHPDMMALSDSGTPAQGVFQPEPGILLPFLRFAPMEDGKIGSGAGLPIDLICTEARLEVSELVEIQKRLEPGRNRVFVNLRDSGLSRTRNWRFPGADAWIAYMLGDSYLAMRTMDLLRVTRKLQEERKSERPIHLHAEGELVPVALHAAALNPELFASVTLHGGLGSWEEVIESRNPVPHLPNVVHGALRHYDLPDLVELIGPEKVTWEVEE